MKKKIKSFENIKIENNIFRICVRVSTRNRLNGIWENKYLNNMEQIKDWDELFPNFHRPSEDQFHWVVQIKKSTLNFKWFSIGKYVTLTQHNTQGFHYPIVLNNAYECKELIRLIKNNVIYIYGAMVGTVNTRINRIEELFEPYVVTFVAYKWCKFRIENNWFLGRTYYDDNDSVKIIGCVFEDGGTQHKYWDEQKFDDFEYLNI